MQSQGTGQLLCQSPAKPEINKPAQIWMWISLIPFWHRCCGYGFWFGYIQTGPDDGTNPANQLICKLSPLFIYQGFIDPRWLFGISEPSTVKWDHSGGHQGRQWLADPWSKSWRSSEWWCDTRNTKTLDLPSRGLTYPTLERKIIFKMPFFGGYVSSLEGNV